MGLKQLLFPRQCVVCGRKGEWLCRSCQKTLPRSPFPLNYRTGFFSPFLYRGGVKKLLWSFKFELVLPLSKIIAKLLAEEISRTPLLSFWQRQHFVIIPVPLHPWRQNWRGFNQAALLGKALAKEVGLSFDQSILQRRRFALPQVGLSRHQRYKNIASQFAATAAAQGKNLILLDDVCTTGATLQEAQKKLQKAKAASVWKVAFAAQVRTC